jgi:thioredoxin reductase
MAIIPMLLILRRLATRTHRAQYHRFSKIIRVDSVIFATGYRPNLAYLASLGALDAEGRALHRHGVSLTVPGLYFMGLSNQRTFASATLRGVGPDAAVVVRYLTGQRAPATHALIPAGPRLAATQICCPTR